MEDLVKVKIEELNGAALDWSACKALGSNPVIEDWGGPNPMVVLSSYEAFEMVPWSPSTNWSQGGMLLEKQKIAVWPTRDGKFSAGQCNGDYWGELDLTSDTLEEGSTALIAICRSVVALKIGQTVEVPKVLLSQ